MRPLFLQQQAALVTSAIAVFLGLLAVIFLTAALIGYVINIFALAGMSFDPITPLLVLRAVGIFVLPLGAILGWY